jgi:ATP-dependent helicase/nuclease subunit A
MSAPASPRLTAEQGRALAVAGSSVALSAGAGCGKTTVLAERFIRALEPPESRSLDRIVALTFTNKAARELRERIRRECRARLESGGDPARWRPILRGLAAARIETFHSFCGQILRRHAIEAGVDPGFSVLDESIAMAIRDEALALSIRERLAERDPDLMELAVEFGLGMVRQSIDDLLGNRSVGDMRQWVTREPRQLVDLWLDRWIGSVRPELMARFAEAARPCLDLLTRTEFDHPKVRARRDELIDAFTRLDSSVDPVPILGEIHELAKVAGLSAKSWPSAEIYQGIKEHFESIRGEAKSLIKALPWDEPTTMMAASHGLRFARLTVRASEAYDLAKRSRGGIDHDDLLLMTRELLAVRSEAVRNSLAGSIDLILVDEFQDTDPVQSEILDHLAGEGFRDGRLFLVGDYKQSIYRFRGARPDLFRRYREDFPVDGQLDLTENFRSVPAVLDFVNALFAETFPEAGAALQAGGGALPEPDARAAVAFLWGESPESVPGAPKPDADARRKDEARRLARYLGVRLIEGWTVLDKKSGHRRVANQGDIAFLFRSLSDASAYESALVAEGLDYHVVGGSGFFAQQEVLDVINALTAVEDPLDAVSLAGALRSPFFSISDDALFWISTEVPGAPYLGLDRSRGEWLDRLPKDDRLRADRARRLLENWRAVKDRIPIAALVDRILDESGYEAALLGEFLGDRKRANARKLVRMARRFDESGGFTLADFVERLRADLRAATKETQAATTDEQGEIIRLMSIHQAKGLEFPIVVVPDLDRKRPGELKRVAFDADLGPLVNPVVEPPDGLDGDEPDPGGCLGWSVHRHRERTEDENEAHRLFYVATTRARDFLILSSATDPDRSPTSPAMKLLDRRFDRRTGRLRGPLPDGWREPRVEVVPAIEPGTLSRAPAHRPRPRLLEVARTIDEGSANPDSPPTPRKSVPRFVELDPGRGLSSTASRLDRLIRSILSDPRAFEPNQLGRVAGRSAFLQDPVSPPGLVAEAIGRLSTWFRTPVAREVARSVDVRRGFTWSIDDLPGAESTVFQGRADLLYRDPSGDRILVILSDPDAMASGERLRLLLSAVAADRSGIGPVRRGLRFELGTGARVESLEGPDARTIEDAIGAAFADLSIPRGYPGR